MDRTVKRILIAVLAVMMVLAEPLMALGPDGFSAVYAAVGSLNEGEDITYDKAGGILKSLGFDTSKMPDDYDPDATTNPYGEDVSTVNEIEEIVRFDKSGSSSKGKLFGHNAKLDGEYNTLYNSAQENDSDFLAGQPFSLAAKCDFTGSGRDSALAIAYTNFDYESESPDRNIYMRLYDSKTGRKSDPFTIAMLPETGLVRDYMVQSQVQITAGDYDKDSVDEIAVYAPSPNTTTRAKVVIYDLTDGKDAQDPYSKYSWREAWNYILPISQQEVVQYSEGNMKFLKNFYNNIDLASGDANNDGICDLVISYGASDTDIIRDQGLPQYESSIKRSTPSKSVLLYGNDRGQMLKDTQVLSYGGNPLIRVSVAFGDVNGDRNEDMFIGGQMQSEQEDNSTRVLGMFHYDENDGVMELESIQDLQIVNGNYGDDGNGNQKFYSANGWDGEYHSVPLMKTNLAIGDVMGEDSTTKIYMDSVLYSVDDGDYEIVDELDDPSKDDDDNYLGSHIFDDMKGYMGHATAPARYYEFGADAGNFTGGFSDYMMVDRVTIDKKFTVAGATTYKEAASSLIVLENANDDTLTAKTINKNYDDRSLGSPYMMTTVDTDRDSMVATYTGQHDINYDSPEVLAVLMSPPYYKDVAAYDNGDMLNYCGTSYSKKTGETTGESHSLSQELGAFCNFEIGADKGVRFMANLGVGWALEATWGDEHETDYEISYATTGGEDAVVLYSTPCENYMYDLEGVTVDDDGNWETFKQDLLVAKKHKRVKQVLTLDDYNEIQKRYSKELPDVSKVVSSKPGYPKSYPKSENDIPQFAKDRLNEDESNKGKGYRVGDDWSGISYGSGTETQSFSYQKTHRDKDDNTESGAYGLIEAGLNNAFGIIGYWQSIAGGLHFTRSTTSGDTASSIEGHDCSGTVINMPMGAKGYGYDFSWKLFYYDLKYQNDAGDKTFEFPVVTYIVADAVAPPELPDSITQDYDRTTDSQLALTWDYSAGDPKEFIVYRYEDFPVGGGDTPIGTVSGGDYRIKKDENGNTIKDKDGHVVREYTFIDTDLTSDTKYQYRLKVVGNTNPSTSIFSPVVEGRTFVANMPDVSLSADRMTIYPDGTYDLLTVLADPEHYQSNISYQWQKYDNQNRKWEDLKGRDKSKLHFYNCEQADAGRYRCRMNLIRKVESHPQYITVYTDPCVVTYSLRDVKFGDIKVFDGTGNASTNTGIYVDVFNKSETSIAKPVGNVTFTITGPNGTFKVVGVIDESTGRAKIDSIEDKIGTIGQKDFCDGGYLITAWYQGSKVFYSAEDPEQYHYLRNIGESLFLSVQSQYFFGDDIAETAYLYDYKKNHSGAVTREDLTDKLTEFKFYQVNDNGMKTGDPVASVKLSETDGKALLPLDAKLSKKAYVEAYMEGSDEPAAGSAIVTRKVAVDFNVQDKMTGTGDLLELMSSKDVVLSNDIDAEEKNIVTDDGKKSLSEYMLFKYYEQNGDYMFDSDSAPDHKDDFIPADYYVQISLKEGEASKFYTPSFRGARFTVVGNYYLVSANADDPNTGVVQMVSPDKLTEFTDEGYPGGTKLTIKAVPEKGFRVSKWKVNECGEREYTLPGTDKIDYVVKSQSTSGDGKVKIKAFMVPKNNTLEFSTKGLGTVSLEQPISSGDVVLADTRLDFTARPNDGWTFDEWRWSNIGGNDTVSGGVSQDDGTNKKTFIMPDNSAVLYAVFKRDTIDITAPNTVDISYINDGSDPLHEIGEEIATDKGRDVPKGVTVKVKTKPGIKLAPGSEWKVTATTPDGMLDLPITAIVEGEQEGCRFDLPSNVESCMVAIDTVKGRYSVETYSDDVTFEISVDGEPAAGNTVTDIESGSQIDIKAIPKRGEILDKWIVNGEEMTLSGDTYSTIITQNLSVTATVKADEKVSLDVSTEGDGIAKYVITDKNGDEVSGTFSGASTTVDAYKGENVLIAAADEDTTHTLTALYIDDEQVELDEGAYTIKDLVADTKIVARFKANTYLNITFTSSTRNEEPLILDEDESEIAVGSSLIIPKGGDASFSIVFSNTAGCEVTEYLGPADTGTKLEPVKTTDYGENKVKYDFELKNMDKAATIDISDHGTMYIYDVKDLIDYLEILQQYQNEDELYKQPDGEVMNDIECGGFSMYMATPMLNSSMFNGNGYTISNFVVDGDASSSTHYRKFFYGIFGNLTEKGVIKDVSFENLSVAAETPTYNSVSGYGGMLTYNNYGTISGVQILDSTYEVSHGNDDKWPVGVLAFDNHGLIENCLVSNVTIDTDDNGVDKGSAGAVFNQFKDADDVEGTMRGNYFEDLYLKLNGGEAQPATSSIMVQCSGEYEHANKGKFENNYYRAGYSVNDIYGDRVYTLTADPDNEEAAVAEVATAEFARKLAYTMNVNANDKLWGVRDNDDTNVLLLKLTKGSKAPIKVDFVSGEVVKSKYYYPGEVLLPGVEVFGEDTPDAWMVGDSAYAPGQIVDIAVDSEIVGVSDIKDYVASVSNISEEGTPVDTKYYKTVMAAMDAAKDKAPLKVELKVLKDCDMTNYVFVMDSNITMKVVSGAKFTMKQTAQIVNDGFIIVEEGAEVHKYGTIANTGVIVIPENTVYNYGTKFTNDGLISEQENIICRPHINGEWIQADEPDADGRWKRTSTCEVCLHVQEEWTDPNPPQSVIDHIEILKVPTKTIYEVGEAFTDEGMVVIAVLTDGTKAAITDYTMSSNLTGEDQPIKNGDVFEEKGDARVTVIYGKFKCGFDIEVRNTADLLTITDENGDEITEAELTSGKSIKLNASLKSKLPYKTEFKWEVDDTEVIVLDSYANGKEKTASAGVPGKATIKVTVVDVNGNPIQAIKSKTVEISVISHITELRILGGDAEIDKGDTHKFELEVIPRNTTDTVEWTSSDEDVATVDENGVVTGVAGGKAVITVTAPNGLSDFRKVYVREKAESLKLEPDALNLNTGGYGSITARAKRPTANSDIVWTVDNEMTAGFFVRNEETGEMEVVNTVTTPLSGDGADYSDAYVVIAGLAAGTANVKASTEGENGEMLEEECEVTVADSEDFAWITHNGARVSGEQFTLSIDGRFIQLGAESSEAGDTFTWKTIDDIEDPVLAVDYSAGDSSKATVLFKRKGTAAIEITSKLTGATDICMIKVIIEPTGVKLAADKLELVEGTSYTLGAELIPEEAEGKLIWTSSDESIATVSDTGEITAIAKGQATITATPDFEGAESASCEVTVIEEVVEIELSDKQLMLEKDKMAVLTATIKPANAKGEIIWTSSDPSVATVDKKGVITGISEGETDIIVTFSKPGSGSATCHVTVYDNGPKPIIPTGVKLSDSDLTLAKGGSYTLRATLLPEGAKGNVLWSSSDESIATVSDEGRVTAVAEGTAIITATPDTEGAESATCTVTVYEPEPAPEPPVQAIVELSDTEVILQEGTSTQITARVMPEGTEGTFSWTSSNTGVATVSDDGTITAVESGTAYVTVSFSKPGSASATCKVTVYEPKLTVELSKETFVYNGKKRLPKVTVKNGDIVLGTNLTKSNNKVIIMFYNPKSTMPGKYKVAAVAREWYYGSGEAQYKIKMKPTKILKIKKNKKDGTVVVRVKKVGKKYLRGYHFRYDTDKNMDDAKSKYLRKWNRTRLTLKKLKPGQKYYIQVRTYERVKGSLCYSKWSKKKVIKIKK